MKIRIILIAMLIMSIAVFESCENQEVSKNENTTEHQQVAPSSDINYMHIGQNLALKTKASLGANLQKAIAVNGAAGAVEFCNLKAIAITDSTARSLNATIRRVSDQPRNRANQAKEGELFYIDMCKQALEKGKDLKPFVSESAEKVVGYYPIVTNSMCLNCHGSSSDINAETLAKINSLYPEDQALNYAANQLRGIFVVEMDK